MPKRVAEAFPDFNFYCIEQTDAYGVAANSEATMKHGEFVCVSGDSDGNFGKRVIGHIIDGNIVFTEENIDMDEGMQILFEEESWKTGSIAPPVFLSLSRALCSECRKPSSGSLRLDGNRSS